MAQITHFSSVSTLSSCMSWSIWVKISPCSFSLFSEGCQIALSCWHHLPLQCPANLAKPFPALPSWQGWVRGCGVSIGITSSHICSWAPGQCHSELSFFRTTLSWGSTDPSEAPMMGSGGIQHSQGATFTQCKVCAYLVSLHKPNQVRQLQLHLDLLTHGEDRWGPQGLSLSVHIY